jgi:hypothetical protein
MIYEVTLTGEYFGQQIINRWNYLSSGAAVGVVPAVALTTALGFVDDSGAFPVDTLAASIQFQLPPNYRFISLLAKAIREAPTDFYDLAYPLDCVGGNSGGTPMSPVLAYGFKTSRTRTDIARGTKRFVGVLESAVGAGGEWEAGVVTWLDDMASKMSATLSYTDGGSSLSFAPIVVQKEKITLESGKVTYRYYETISEQMEHIAQGIVWDYYRNVRTQNTRQYGHGA